MSKFVEWEIAVDGQPTPENPVPLDAAPKPMEASTGTGDMLSFDIRDTSQQEAAAALQAFEASGLPPARSGPPAMSSITGKPVPSVTLSRVAKERMAAHTASSGPSTAPTVPSSMPPSMPPAAEQGEDDDEALMDAILGST